MIQFCGDFDKSSASKITTTTTTTKSFLRSLTHYMLAIKNEWDGMVGNLINRDTDFVMADMTITEERQKVIDFLLPIAEDTRGFYIRGKKTAKLSVYHLTVRLLISVQMKLLFCLPAIWRQKIKLLSEMVI